MNRKYKILFDKVLREFRIKTRNKKRYCLYMKNSNFLYMLNFCYKQQVKAFYTYKYILKD
jgi:hypothetical protein